MSRSKGSDTSSLSRAELERYLLDLKSKNLSLKRRLDNRTAQVELLLQQIVEIKEAAEAAGIEVVITWSGE